MKVGIVTTLVTGGFALLYLFLTRMKKKQSKKLKDVEETTCPPITSDDHEKNRSEVEEKCSQSDKELVVISEEINTPDNKEQAEDNASQPVADDVCAISEATPISSKGDVNEGEEVQKSLDYSSDVLSDAVIPTESEDQTEPIAEGCAALPLNSVNLNVEMAAVESAPPAPTSELDVENEEILENENPECEFSQAIQDKNIESECTFNPSHSEHLDEPSKDESPRSDVATGNEKEQLPAESSLQKSEPPSQSNLAEADKTSNDAAAETAKAAKKKRGSPQKQAQDSNAQEKASPKLNGPGAQQNDPPPTTEEGSLDKPPPKTRRHKKRERKKAKEALMASKDSSAEQPQPSSNDKSQSTSTAAENGTSCPYVNGNPAEDSAPQLLSSSGDLACTSDWEREASPEQENQMSDSHSLISQASLDSGQGSIEVEPETIFSSLAFPSGSSDQYMFYTFEIPQTLVGRLIGKKGSFVNKVKASTSSSIVVLDHKNKKLKLCSLEGQKNQVAEALKMIRKQFPLNQFPELTLEQVNTPTPSPLHQPKMDRQFLQVELPPGVVIETQAGCVCSAGEIWLQQPLHPSFAALQKLHQCINLNYGDGSTSPPLPTPIGADTVCVCCIDSHWLRCIILDSDSESCLVNLVDIGGTVRLPINAFRQIRVDYMNLPFQASQCFLHGLQPPTADGWEEGGRLALEDMVKNTIVFASIAAYSEDGTPFVNLYKREFNEYVYINKRLVELGHASWLVTETSP